MTAPVTGITPLYNLEYLVEGEPLRYTRQKIERNAKSIEAALALRAIPPADIAALVAAGWFSDTGWTDITPAAGFAVLSTAEKPQVRRRAGLLLFQGGFSNTGMAASGTYNVATLPAPFRPAQTAIVGVGSSAGAAVASGFLTSAGVLSLRLSATLGGYYKLDAFSGTLGA
jgi:hypothetical protein